MKKFLGAIVLVLMSPLLMIFILLAFSLSKRPVRLYVRKAEKPLMNQNPHEYFDRRYDA
jgi:hypothetical protein